MIVRVEKNENFERKDKDLYYNLVLDFSTAVLGGEVEIPTLEGKTTIKIEPAPSRANRFAFVARECQPSRDTVTEKETSS